MLVVGVREQGIDFVGYVGRPNHRVLRTSTKHRMFVKMKQKIRSYNAGECDEDAVGQSLQSYLGLLKHCEGYIIEEQLLNEIWLERTLFNSKISIED